MKRKQVELLAPAGSLEGFYGAIQAGADAVYLGGTRFSARAYADNFTEEELIFSIRYAHVLGRKVYLTVNTLVKEKEFNDLFDYLCPFYEAGVDGVIVQDLGVLAMIGRTFPNLELHASTQMSVTGSNGAEMLKNLGVNRIVPARELSLKEIKAIKADTGLEIEAFIHGAMCYCYSGQCLFSSILGGRSGNRGRCAQPCRLPYQVKIGQYHSKECYPMSLKDMCTVEYLPDLIEAGIDSFKIEGRMKKPEYAAGVTAIYRKYIDRYYQEKEAGTRFSRTIDPKDMEQLSGLYLRSERQTGYYFMQNGAEMITLGNPSYSGSQESILTQVRTQFLNNKISEPISLTAQFHVGKNAVLTVKSNICSVTVQGKVVQSAVKQPITRENIEKQLNKLRETVFYATQISVDLSDNAFYSLKAINDLRRKAILALEEKQLEVYGFSNRHSIPLQEGFALEKNAAHFQRTENIGTRKNKVTWSVVLRTEEQLQGLQTFLEKNPTISLERITIDGDLLLKETVVQKCEKLSQLNPLFLALPYILRRRDQEYLQAVYSLLSQSWIEGCMVRSLEGYAYLKKVGYCGKIILDQGMYLWNQESLDFWNDKVLGFCLPVELNAGEQRELLNWKREGFQTEKIVYGRIPMMITANCVAKTTGHCFVSQSKQEEQLIRVNTESEEYSLKENCTKHKEQDMIENKYLTQERLAYLQDRYHKEFPVVVNCRHCFNILYNSVALTLYKGLEKWYGKVMFRLDFTIEGEAETMKILQYFQNIQNESNAALPAWEYTTGHEKRGVE